RGGETYDARRELNGWAAEGFDDRTWRQAQALSSPKGQRVPQRLPPIKINQTLKPVKVSEPRPGVYVFDFGQNFSGWARLSVSGPAGAAIRMKYGERLWEDGTLNQTGINNYTEGRFQTDEYILKGGGTEAWEPRFCYHSFRYVEVTGLPGPPSLDSLLGRVVYSSVEPAGSFVCSNDLLNQIQKACVWTLISNIHSIPQDCPHREKMGWMADGLASSTAAIFNFNMSEFYRKWLDDMRDAQTPGHGGMPSIVPWSGWESAGDPGGKHACPCWGSTCVILPWKLYRQYGDTQFLANNYAMMRDYTDSLEKRSQDHVISFGLGDWLEVGSLSRPSRTPMPLTSTAYLFYDASLVSRAAALLGKPDEENKYQVLATDVQSAFQKNFFQPSLSGYARESQTAQALPLAIGLVPANLREAVFGTLVTNVTVARKNHISSGIVGTPYVLDILTQNGRADLAYAMVSQTDSPGWGDMIRRGNTTISEDWGGVMSLNHPALSCVSAWFYQALAGINSDPDFPGFKRIVISPQVVGDLTFVKGSYQSVYGLIRSEWSRNGSQVELHIEIPANTEADVFLPADASQPVMEGGRPADKVAGVSLVSRRESGFTCRVGSGTYNFTFTLNRVAVK
ncbi:MAG: family 78 glycoside hydrolase catalytic domain, partial [Kiritimatiellales bacterium]